MKFRFKTRNKNVERGEGNKARDAGVGGGGNEIVGYFFINVVKLFVLIESLGKEKLGNRWR